jgi:pyrroline-5-carboxylate reductase
MITSMDSIGIVGCGKMGTIILEGILKGDLFKSIFVTVPDEKKRSDLAAKYPTVKLTEIEELAKACYIVVICVKPYVVHSVLDHIVANAKEATVIVSIAAGITISDMRKHNPNGHFVRVMPNTPCRVGEGMSVVVPGNSVPKDVMDKIVSIFNTLGRTIQLAENQMDAATALSGSGPGLILCLLESLADGALLCGIPKYLAIEMAAQTMLGTAKLVLDSGKHPAVLRDEVCTPGGCTIAGIASLEEDGVRSALINCIKETAEAAGRQRSK